MRGFRHIGPLATAMVQFGPIDHLVNAARKGDAEQVRKLLVDLTLMDPEMWILAVADAVRRLDPDDAALELISRNITLTVSR